MRNLFAYSVADSVFMCVEQSGISDTESHSNALKILLQMGEFFQIQVAIQYLQFSPIHCSVILLHDTAFEGNRLGS